MELMKMSLKLAFLGFLVLNVFVVPSMAQTLRTVHWVLEETNYTRLCSSKNILTVNGSFPGPTLHVHKGEKLIVNVQNQGKYNVTIHWHGVKQPRNPWSDGPEYITQCPIQPGANFSYEIIFSTEEGTLWWHAHSDWSRATVHGPIIVYPANGTTYPYSKPSEEFPIVLASWFKGDVMELIQSALESGGEPNQSDAFTINGQPGDLYNCSKPGTFRILVDYGKTYLLRIINSIMNEEMFFMVAQHNLTVVGMDGAYIKPINTDYIMITPGQTMDVLITANQTPSEYYMAARAYAGLTYDNTTTTAIVQYSGNYTAPSTPAFPILPNYTDIDAVTNFTRQMKALNSKEHPVDVPQTVDTKLYITISVNTLPCVNSSCDGPNGDRLAASLNNISFVTPEVDVLLAYHNQLQGIFTKDFPSQPPYFFDFTANNVSDDYLTPLNATKVKVVEFNSTVEMVFQTTNVMNAAENHPMHLHGYSFYFVGFGFGNFNNETDPTGYNLVDPPEVNTVGVPTNGWAAIRFRADNPGVWFMHCHLERHSSWGMDTVLIVKNGTTNETSMLDPPAYLNPC
ncbi:Laccase-14 [Camellia lanceoleosa]|uniref:Laccase-14 n=1 Tax=Camellia lanceoleosa TaxID=1840588 RepID=A0ACC0GYI8_9ERIC|nr:Laccase-14 [Camellia lanceoleosa]KAI8005385.1 Laccase-14 [Camellia lanceoleosa]